MLGKLNRFQARASVIARANIPAAAPANMMTRRTLPSAYPKFWPDKGTLAWSIQQYVMNASRTPDATTNERTFQLSLRLEAYLVPTIAEWVLTEDEARALS